MATPPPGPISGTWKASPRATGAYVDRIGGYARNWGVSADPDHNRTDIPDPGFPAMVPPPGGRTWTPPFMEDYFDPEGDPLPYFAATEQEPAGHDVPKPPNGGVLPHTADLEANAARSVYRGADTSRNRPMVMRQADERNISELRRSGPATPLGVEGTGTLTGQALRAVRGRNSLAPNNPGSPEVNFSGNYVRQGQELYRWAMRKMPYNTITPTMRVLHGNWAAGDRETDPIDSPYTSYLPGGRGLTQGNGPQTPYQRREPRPWDEDAVRDGTEGDQGSDEYLSWGL
jgi:hypothetical protein